MADRRPFLAAVATAVVSTGLLALAIGLDWLGPDVGRGAQFCEAARDGWLKQPANALSNVGFVVAGLVIGWQAPRRPLRFDGLAAAYACVVVLLGPASAAMHATQSAVGGRLDMTSMYLVAGFAAAYALTRWWRREPSVLLAGLPAAGRRPASWSGSPGRRRAGRPRRGATSPSGPLLVVAAAVEAQAVAARCRAPRGRAVPAWRTGPPAVASIALAFAIWNALPARPGATPTRWSRATPRGTCSDAVAAYLLFRPWASELGAGR